MFLFGLPGHLDDGRAWMGWLSVLSEEWQWYNFLLIFLGTITLGYAVAPEKLLSWAVRQFRPVPRAVPPSSGAAEQEERVFTKRAAIEILDQLKELTSVGIQKHAAPYIGKWIRIQSTIRDIDANGHFYYVHIGKKKFMPVTLLAFSKQRWGAHIETMDRGDRLAAVGKIVKLDYMAMYLDHCEIVEEREHDDTF